MSESLAAKAVDLPPHTPGWTLPAAYYLDERIFRAELDTVFRADWLFAGHSCEVARPGDYLVFDLGTESVIVVRDDEGVLRAHHNVCRHRGSRICDEPRGSARAFVCPYHQWTYALDGQLRAARLMGDDFAKSGHRLGAVAVRELAGLVYLCLANDPPPFGRCSGSDRQPTHPPPPRTRANCPPGVVPGGGQLEDPRGEQPRVLPLPRQPSRIPGVELRARQSRRPAPIAELRRAPRQRVPAVDGGTAWRPTTSASPDGAWFRVARLPLRDGFRTESLDGSPVAPPMGDVGADPGSLRLIGLPTMWAHANLDYAVTTRLTPVSPSATDVEVCFLVDGAVSDAEVDLEGLTAVWTATSEQDWALCARNYAGIRSRAYRPGPLSPVVEASVQHFIEWYVKQLCGDTQTPAS